MHDVWRGLEFYLFNCFPGCFKRQCCSYGRPQSSRWNLLFAFFALINVSQTLMHVGCIHNAIRSKKKKKDLKLIKHQLLLYIILNIKNISYSIIKSISIEYRIFVPDLSFSFNIGLVDLGPVIHMLLITSEIK